MKKYLFLIALLTILSIPTASAQFTDVEQTHSYYNAINWLQTQGVVEGYDDGTFKADQNVNRAEFLKMLYESAGTLPDASVVTINFPDVPANEWYTKYVKIGYDHNVVEGYPDGYFRPENPINRAEALKIVTSQFFTNEPDLYFNELTEVEKLSVEGCEEDGHFLSDVEAYSWYEQYFFFAHSKCLIPGTMIEDLAPPSDDLIMPDKLLTRGEMAELLYRTKSLSDSGQDKYDASMQPNDLGSLQ